MDSGLAEGIKIFKDVNDKTGFLLEPGCFLTDAEKANQEKILAEKQKKPENNQGEENEQGY